MSPLLQRLKPKSSVWRTTLVISVVLVVSTEDSARLMQMEGELVRLFIFVLVVYFN